MKTKLERRLDEIIGVEDLNDLDGDDEREPLPTKVDYDEVESKVVAVVGDEESDKLDDYKFSRKILYGLINRGTVALEGSLMIARESEHPRAYEVSAGIMKSIAEMTKDLLELQKVVNNDTTKQAAPRTQINIQNNYNSTEDPKELDRLLDDLIDSEDL